MQLQFFGLLVALISPLAAPGVMGSAIFGNGTECPAPASQGSWEDGVILAPKPNQTVTPGKEFLVQFCSGRYFKTSTVAVSYVVEDTTAGSESEPYVLRYNINENTFNTTLPTIDGQTSNAGYQKDHEYSLVIAEVHTNYYGSDSVTLTRVPVDVQLS